MIYALETKAASVAKRMSTAMFVCNDIRSKYVGILSKSVDYAAKYVYPVRYLFWEHVHAGILYSLYV